MFVCGRLFVCLCGKRYLPRIHSKAELLEEMSKEGDLADSKEWDGISGRHVGNVSGRTWRRALFVPLATRDAVHIQSSNDPQSNYVEVLG